MLTNNPIDKDKIAENPHLLPYAHTLGSAIIKPLDKGRIKGLAMAAMYEQTGDKLQTIKKQIELLVTQAQDIHERINISEKIYEAKYNFKPIIGQQYYLYLDTSKNYILSMISPSEWGKSLKYEFKARAKVLSDHTWEILKNMTKDYIPVSCDLVDLIEIEATRRNTSSILLDLNGFTGHIKAVIKTWVTENSIEYLITKENLKIRLDQIVEFNNTRIENNCVIRTYQ